MNALAAGQQFGRAALGERRGRAGLGNGASSSVPHKPSR
jgi:hypothetical protein